MKRFQEFVVEDFSRVNRVRVLFCVHPVRNITWCARAIFWACFISNGVHIFLLMIISDDYIVRVATVKAETDAPLVVDANAVISAVFS